MSIQFSQSNYGASEQSEQVEVVVLWVLVKIEHKQGGKDGV